MRKTVATLLLALLFIGNSALAAESSLNLKEMGIFFVGGEKVDGSLPVPVPNTNRGGEQASPGRDQAQSSRRTLSSLEEQPGVRTRQASQQAASGGRGGSAGSQTQIVNQAMVHYLIPSEIEHDVPIIMVPGLGLSSYIYLSTPDGRDGWAQQFARDGFPVYVFDEPTNAIAGVDTRPLQARTVDSSSPSFSKWPNEQIWSRWGLGPKPGVAYEGSQYPSEYIDQLLSSFTAYTNDQSGSRFNAKVKAAGLTALLEKTGPAIIIAHSAGASTAYEATRLRPDLVKGLVLVEPASGLTDEKDIQEHFLSPLYLAVYGDYLEERGKTNGLQGSIKTAATIEALGGTAEVLHLPELGISGNSHLMMQGYNNNVIQSEIAEWIADRL